MDIGEGEMIAVSAFAMLWWLFYFLLKMRADHKYIKADADEDLRPCMGCLITQAAMMSACVLALIYGVIAMELIGFKR